MSNTSGKEAVKVFKKIGYYLDHQQGSHMILYNDQQGYPPLCIPNHKELAPGLLAAQIKRAKLTVDEFNQMRKGGKG
ncbi:MAG: type II toxin-antitoxin system HicA family toxin [bacterium]|nr:type II toxin-antitoxin system HicA family toxin [bacterium]